MNPFKKYQVPNPSPVEMAANSGQTTWEALTKVRIHVATMDERIRFNTWAIGLLVGMQMMTLGLVIGTVLA